MPVSRYPTALTVTTCTVFFVLFAALLPSPALAQEALSDTERTIVAAVDADVAAGLILLEAAVNINSGSMNAEGVREVGRLFRGELDALGFETRWVDGTPFERGGHLVAERPGNGPTILLIGHLDTVFELDSPFQRYELLNDSTARGPGIIDMKGGDVIIVEALRALRAAGTLDDACITVIMTGDEEKAGRPLDLARAALVEAAQRSDVSLGFEDGDGNPRTAVVARRGASRWLLRVRGTPAHSSQIFQPEYGSGAIYEASRILLAFHDELSGWEDLTFNPGVIVGGTTANFDAEQGRGDAFGKNNVIAGTAIVSGDLRAVSPEQRSGAEKRMREIVADHLPRTEAEIEFVHSYPPMAATAGNLELLGLYDQVSRDLGFGSVTAVDPRAAGAADVSFTAGHVDMALDGLGLMGTGGHTVEETADLGTLPMQTKRAAILIYRLTHGAPGASGG